MSSGFVLAAGSVLDPLYTALGWLMAQLYRFIPNYAVAIILLTVAVRLVLYPLTVKQTKSMQAMQRLQPEIKRLQQKYKGDKQKLNEEMMKFYKENQVNPLAGCLPLVLQLPLFIVLYRLIHDLTKFTIVFALGVAPLMGGAGSVPQLNNPTFTNVHADGGTLVHGRAVDTFSVSADVTVDGKPIGHLRNAIAKSGVLHGAGGKGPADVVDANGRLIGTVADVKVAPANRKAEPKHIPKGSKLATNLEKTPGQMKSVGIDLAVAPKAAKGSEVVPLYLLVGLTVLTGYYQQRQMTVRTPASAQNPQTQMMGRIFPIFFGFISLQIPAGVVLYFVVSNVWQIGQQALIFRQQDAADGKSGGKPPAKPIAPPPKASAVPPQTDNPQPPAKPKNPQPAGKSGSNPGNRSRRRRRRRKGR